jgi:hypothetical protein
MDSVFKPRGCSSGESPTDGTYSRSMPMPPALVRRGDRNRYGDRGTLFEIQLLASVEMGNFQGAIKKMM